MVLPALGVTYGSYEREGWSRFQIKDVVYEDNYVRVAVKEARGPQPIAYGWERVFGDRQVASPLDASEWMVEVKDSSGLPGEGTSYRSVPGLMDDLDDIIGALRDWLPDAELRDGKLTGIGVDLSFPLVVWKEGVVELGIELDGQNFGAEGLIDYSVPDLIRAQLTMKPEPAQIDLVLTHGENISGTLTWLTNKVDVTGTFDREHWMPGKLLISGERLAVPSARIGLDDYQDLEGGVSALWENERLVFDVGAIAEPLSKYADRLPAVSAQIKGEADFEEIRFRNLDVESPALTLELSRPISLGWKTYGVSGSAELAVQVDLKRLPIVEMEGVFSGNLLISPGKERLPNVDFELVGAGLSGYGMDFQSMTLDGRLRDGKVGFDNITLNSGEEFSLAGEGRLNVSPLFLDEMILQVEATEAFAERWLPEGLEFDQVRVSDLRLSGELSPEVEHSGKLEVQRVKYPDFNPIDLRAVWTGVGDRSLKTELVATAETAALSFVGSVDRSGEVGVSDFQLTRAGETVLELTEPATLSMHAPNEGTGLVINVPQLKFAGTGKQVEIGGKVEWPVMGEIRVSGQGMEPSLVAGFFEKGIPSGSIEHLDAEIGWNDGPATWRLKTEIATVVEGFSQTMLEADLKGNERGANVRALVVRADGDELLTASGVFPLVLHPADQDQMIHLPLEGELSGVMSVRSAKAVLGLIERFTPLRLTEMEADLALSGSVREPSIEIDGTTGEVFLARGEDGSELVPLIKSFRIDGRVSKDAMNVADAVIDLDEAQIEIRGTLPLGNSFWDAIPDALSVDLMEHASGELSMTEMPVQGLESFLPRDLKREGTASVSLQLDPGLKLNGELMLKNVSTLPLSMIGSVRQIGGRLLIEDNVARFEEAGLELGGRMATIIGGMSLDVRKLFAGELPIFDLRIVGEELPLARATGMILRSDLDVRIANDGESPPMVSGDLMLRRSFYRSELDLLAFNDVKVPEMKPPFFSVEQVPFNQWQFDLRIRGDRFMLVRSPVFKGTVSANLQLKGSFEQPLLLGDIVIPQGTLTFPFANLYITRALVTASPSNPQDPRVLVTAVSRISEFNITMNASGSLNEPEITFSSSPPLTSKEILLLISAGSMPSETGDMSASDRMGKLAVFLGKDLINKFGTGEPTEDRWIIRSGESTSSAGKSTYMIEYLLGDRWSIIGEYDEYDALNTGVKWKVLGR